MRDLGDEAALPTTDLEIINRRASRDHVTDALFDMGVEHAGMALIVLIGFVICYELCAESRVPNEAAGAASQQRQRATRGGARIGGSGVKSVHQHRHFTRRVERYRLPGPAYWTRAPQFFILRCDAVRVFSNSQARR